MRLSPIRWRVGVILVIGMLAMVSVPVALYYAARGVDEIAGLPPPQQLAAIVRLIEGTPRTERDRVFEALRSTQLSVRVANGANVVTDLDPLWPGDETRMARYRAMLAERAFAAYAVPRGLFSRGFFSPLTAAEFRVSLRGGGVLIVASESVALLTDRGVPLGFPTAFLGVVVAFITLILLNREFRPVMRLARALETLDPTDPEARLPHIRAGTAEVRLLIKAFDRQQERVAALLRARSALVGGIQHDVRTFATRLRLRVEKLANPDDRQHAETDIADLVSLMDGALLATKSEVGKLDLELVDIADLIRAELRDRAAVGARADLIVDPTAEGAEVLGDRVSLRRIVSNLVDNALRYGNAAHVSLAADETSLRLIVGDEGPGIPEDRRSNLLQPFSRLEPSRSRQTGGSGLGLAIVQTLVEAHEGTVSISDTTLGGALIVVRRPRFFATDAR